LIRQIPAPITKCCNFGNSRGLRPRRTKAPCSIAHALNAFCTAAEPVEHEVYPRVRRYILAKQNRNHAKVAIYVEWGWRRGCCTSIASIVAVHALSSMAVLRRDDRTAMGSTCRATGFEQPDRCSPPPRNDNFKRCLHMKGVELDIANFAV
jgi:hypothetical protein